MSLESKKIAIDAAIFDLDGTLIDTLPLYYRMVNTAFKQLDLPPVSKEILVEALKDGDFNWDVVLPSVAEDQKEASIAKARKVINDIAVPLLQNELELVSGTVEALNQLDRAGIKLGLVTSTPKISMAMKLGTLKAANVLELFQVVMDGDDVEKKKPHAEPLVTCSQKLGVLADRCVYVGDTRVDIRAGKAAGMNTIAVLTGFEPYDILRNETPDAIIDSIGQLNNLIVMES